MVGSGCFIFVRILTNEKIGKDMAYIKDTGKLVHDISFPAYFMSYTMLIDY